MAGLFCSSQRDVECVATAPWTSPMTRTHPPALPSVLRRDTPAITVVRRLMVHR